MSARREDLLQKAVNTNDLDSIQEVITLEEINNYIDEVEKEVDKAKDLLEGIKDVTDLHKVEECLKLLNNLSGELY
jgi:hypothetical protein